MCVCIHICVFIYDSYDVFCVIVFRASWVRIQGVFGLMGAKHLKLPGQSQWL